MIIVNICWEGAGASVAAPGADAARGAGDPRLPQPQAPTDLFPKSLRPIREVRILRLRVSTEASSRL